MFCSNCGKQAPDGAKFCTGCGTPLATPVAPTPAAPVVEAPAPVVEPVAPVVEAPAPVVEPVAPVVEAPAPVVEPVAPVVEAPAPVVEPVAPVVEAPAPVVEPVAPVVVEPTPVVVPVAPVVTEPATAPAPVAPTPVAAPAPVAPTPVAAPAPVAPKAKTPGWAIAVIIILALAVVGAAGYIVYDKFLSDDSYSDSDDDGKKDKKNSSGSSSGDNSSNVSSDETPGGNNSSPTTSPSTNVNSAYTALFTNYNLVDDADPVYGSYKKQIVAKDMYGEGVQKFVVFYDEDDLMVANFKYYYITFETVAYYLDMDAADVTSADAESFVNNYIIDEDAPSYTSYEYTVLSNVVKVLQKSVNLDDQSVTGEYPINAPSQIEAYVNSGYIKKYN